MSVAGESFIPPATMRVLSDPRFVEFWADQPRIYSEQKLVVIREDSDAALMTRASDNREQVSAILNLSDGMLGDFLRLQIICTINCTTADIDPALLRPGQPRTTPRLRATPFLRSGAFGPSTRPDAARCARLLTGGSVTWTGTTEPGASL